jgi:hypothetical protein
MAIQMEQHTVLQMELQTELQMNGQKELRMEQQMHYRQNYASLYVLWAGAGSCMVLAGVVSLCSYIWRL